MNLTNFKNRNLLSGQLLILGAIIFLFSIVMSLTSCTGTVSADIEPETIGKLYNGEITLKSYIDGQWLIQKHEFIYSTVDRMSGVTAPQVQPLKSCITSKLYTDRFNTFIKGVKFDNFSIKTLGVADCPNK